MLFSLGIILWVFLTLFNIPSNVLSKQKSHRSQSNTACPEAVGPTHRCVSATSCLPAFRNSKAHTPKCGPNKEGFCCPVIHPHSSPSCGIRHPQMIFARSNSTVRSKRESDALSSAISGQISVDYESFEENVDDKAYNLIQNWKNNLTTHNEPKPNKPIDNEDMASNIEEKNKAFQIRKNHTIRNAKEDYSDDSITSSLSSITTKYPNKDEETKQNLTKVMHEVTTSYPIDQTSFKNGVMTQNLTVSSVSTKTPEMTRPVTDYKYSLGKDNKTGFGSAGLTQNAIEENGKQETEEETIAEDGVATSTFTESNNTGKMEIVMEIISRQKQKEFVFKDRPMPIPKENHLTSRMKNLYKQKLFQRGKYKISHLGKEAKVLMVDGDKSATIPNENLEQSAEVGNPILDSEESSLFRSRHWTDLRQNNHAIQGSHEEPFSPPKCHCSRVNPNKEYEQQQVIDNHKYKQQVNSNQEFKLRVNPNQEYERRIAHQRKPNDLTIFHPLLTRKKSRNAHNRRSILTNYRNVKGKTVSRSVVYDLSKISVFNLDYPNDNLRLNHPIEYYDDVSKQYCKCHPSNPYNAERVVYRGNPGYRTNFRSVLHPDSLQSYPIQTNANNPYGQNVLNWYPSLNEESETMLGIHTGANSNESETAEESQMPPAVILVTSKKSRDLATSDEDVNMFDVNLLVNVTSLDGDVENEGKSSQKDPKAQTESNEESEEQTPVRESKPQFTIGGSLETTPWPWMVGIYSYPSLNFICGGTLIDHQHVLSAAHCFYGDGKNDQYAVVIGNLDRIAKRVRPKNFFRAEKLYIHEKFTPECFCHDIALLRLRNLLSAEYTPICLPQSDTAGPGEHGTVLGWGDTKYSKTADSSTKRLQRLEDVIIYPGNECHNIISKIAGKQLPETFGEYYICAGVPDGSKDACVGDSGGPLMHEDYDGLWSLIGVVSFGYKCGNPGTPGTYARVSYFIPWIMNLIEKKP